MIILNSRQEAAVKQDLRHSLILAGAGSGKTMVLTERVKWLIHNFYVNPSNLFIVTFTNKAARELSKRISISLQNIDIKNMWIGTFHGLCNKFLRINYINADLPKSFYIISISEQMSIIRDLIKKLHLDQNKFFEPRYVQKFINKIKDTGTRSQHFHYSEYNKKKMEELYVQYENRCKKDGLVDFSELILRSCEVLKKFNDIKTYYGNKFSHILIDEFQDTSPLQYQLIQLLSGKDSNIFAVGDDDQSIYAFRGANVGNMSRFDLDYAKGNIIRLEQNYRSDGHILDASNALISNNVSRLGKKLWTEQNQGDRIYIVPQHSDIAEANWIVNRIKTIIRQGIIGSEIAILYRSNAQSRILEHSLFLEKIQYRVYGGLRFFDRQEIKYAIAYLRLIVNQNDDTAFLKVVNFPPRGVGERTLSELIMISENNEISLFNAHNKLNSRSYKSVSKFVNFILEMNTNMKNLPLSEFIQILLEKSGLINYYSAKAENLGNADKVENLKELVTAAKIFENEWKHVKNFNVVDEFLSYMILEGNHNNDQNLDNVVQLMTVHSAKGLEFHTVFITGLEDGLFPHENSLAIPTGLEEERRLMYVAMTRARKALYISYSLNRILHGQDRRFPPSRFLDEIPNTHFTFIKEHNRLTATTNYAEKNNDNFFVGQWVKHLVFGSGKIITLSGTNKNSKIEILFNQFGKKTFLLGMVKLKSISDSMK